MSAPADRPDALAAFTLILLRHGDRYLLLRRAATKRFAPGKWTGLGGRVEPGEWDALRSAALRELAEETGIAPDQVRNLTLRRALLHARPGAPLTVLLYLTGDLAAPLLPASPEGTLAWVAPEEVPGLALIDNAALVLPRLIEDLTRDPDGREPVRVGAARYAPDGTLEAIVWA